LKLPLIVFNIFTDFFHLCMPQGKDMLNDKAGVYISVVAAMIMWSLTFVWFKIANEVYGPFTIVFLRLIISTVILLGISWFSSVLQKMQRGDLLRFLVLAFIYPFVYFIAESLGLTMISASQGAVIISTIPLIVPLGAYLLLNERVTILNIAGILISFTGVIIVVMKRNFSFDAPPAGILLMLVAVFSAVGYTLMVKKLTGKYNAFTITTYQNTIGSVLFLPLFLIPGRIWFLPGIYLFQLWGKGPRCHKDRDLHQYHSRTDGCIRVFHAGRGSWFPEAVRHWGCVVRTFPGPAEKQEKTIRSFSGALTPGHKNILVSFPFVNLTPITCPG
jgi:drug/metabolite transporter (DMT)-like permease